MAATKIHTRTVFRDWTDALELDKVVMTVESESTNFDGAAMTTKLNDIWLDYDHSFRFFEVNVDHLQTGKIAVTMTFNNFLRGFAAADEILALKIFNVGLQTCIRNFAAEVATDEGDGKNEDDFGVARMMNTNTDEELDEESKKEAEEKAQKEAEEKAERIKEAKDEILSKFQEWILQGYPLAATCDRLQREYRIYLNIKNEYLTKHYSPMVNRLKDEFVQKKSDPVYQNALKLLDQEFRARKKQYGQECASMYTNAMKENCPPQIIGHETKEESSAAASETKRQSNREKNLSDAIIFLVRRRKELEEKLDHFATEEPMWRLSVEKDTIGAELQAMKTLVDDYSQQIKENVDKYNVKDGGIRLFDDDLEVQWAIVLSSKNSFLKKMENFVHNGTNVQAFLGNVHANDRNKFFQDIENKDKTEFFAAVKRYIETECNTIFDSRQNVKKLLYKWDDKTSTLTADKTREHENYDALMECRKELKTMVEEIKYEKTYGSRETLEKLMDHYYETGRLMNDKENDKTSFGTTKSIPLILAYLRRNARLRTDIHIGKKTMDQLRRFQTDSMVKANQYIKTNTDSDVKKDWEQVKEIENDLFVLEQLRGVLEPVKPSAAPGKKGWFSIFSRTSVSPPNPEINPDYRFFVSYEDQRRKYIQEVTAVEENDTYTCAIKKQTIEQSRENLERLKSLLKLVCTKVSLESKWEKLREDAAEIHKNYLVGSVEIAFLKKAPISNKYRQYQEILQESKFFETDAKDIFDIKKFNLHLLGSWNKTVLKPWNEAMKEREDAIRMWKQWNNVDSQERKQLTEQITSENKNRNLPSSEIEKRIREKSREIIQKWENKIREIEYHILDLHGEIEQFDSEINERVTTIDTHKPQIDKKDGQTIFGKLHATYGAVLSYYLNLDDEEYDQLQKEDLKNFKNKLTEYGKTLLNSEDNNVMAGEIKELLDMLSTIKFSSGPTDGNSHNNSIRRNSTNSDNESDDDSDDEPDDDSDNPPRNDDNNEDHIKHEKQTEELAEMRDKTIDCYKKYVEYSVKRAFVGAKRNGSDEESLDQKRLKIQKLNEYIDTADPMNPYDEKQMSEIRANHGKCIPDETRMEEIDTAYKARFQEISQIDDEDIQNNLSEFKNLFEQISKTASEFQNIAKKSNTQQIVDNHYVINTFRNEIMSRITNLKTKVHTWNDSRPSAKPSSNHLPDPPNQDANPQPETIPIEAPNEMFLVRGGQPSGQEFSFTKIDGVQRNYKENGGFLDTTNLSGSNEISLKDPGLTYLIRNNHPQILRRMPVFCRSAGAENNKFQLGYIYKKIENSNSYFIFKKDDILPNGEENAARDHNNLHLYSSDQTSGKDLNDYKFPAKDVFAFVVDWETNERNKVYFYDDSGVDHQIDTSSNNKKNSTKRHFVNKKVYAFWEVVIKVSKEDEINQVVHLMKTYTNNSKRKYGGGRRARRAKTYRRPRRPRGGRHPRTTQRA
jgi:hypothetical protein